MFKNALISVSNKNNIDTFLKPFAEKGMRILSTGGTSSHLRKKGFKVCDVSEQTKFEEVMGNRVKTLHPFIHMCLLARDDFPEDLSLLKKYKLQPIDLLVVNLYPFHQHLDLEERKQADWIDIGGPTLLRAAAKNYFRITVISDPLDYQWVLEKKGQLTQTDRKKLAIKAFSHISLYDSIIAEEWKKNLVEKKENKTWKKPSSPQNNTASQKKDPPQISQDSSTQQEDSLDNFWKEISWGGLLMKKLRYGENPHQKAFWYKSPNQIGLQNFEVLQGKALSYNNLLDLDAALKTLFEFKEEICCVGVKHQNPCAVACHASSVSQAVQSALQADPLSIFGGVLALNTELDEKSALLFEHLFLECVLAKSFSRKALYLLQKKKNLRLLKLSSPHSFPSLSQKNSLSLQMKNLLGGFLVQTTDQVNSSWSQEWEIFGQPPSKERRQDLLMAWKVCAHLKSNAISLVSDQKTVGLGMGQVNRVDAVDQAIKRMKNFHPKSQNVVLASDAFFPFPDSIERAAQDHIKWIIQPGGSLKDKEVKKKAKELKVNLILTKKRHFLH